MKRLRVALVIVVRDGRVLVTKRPAEAHMGGLWELPGGKVRPGEEPEAAARRELLEETGLRVDRLEPRIECEHEYPDRTIHFHVFVGRDPLGDLRGRRFVTPRELSALPMPPANRAFVGALSDV